MRRTSAMATVALCAAATMSSIPQLAANSAEPRPESGQVPAGLVRTQVTESLLGTHTWFEQTHQGLPVIGGYYAVHDNAGRTRVDDGRKTVTGLASVKAAYGRANAEAKAGENARGKVFQGRLAILPGDAAQLVWDLHTEGGKNVLVSAKDGRVVKVASDADHVDGTGKVFDPSPVVSQQNGDLKDAADADSAVPAAAYSTVTLKNLDGSGYLRGSWARVINKTSGKQPAAYSSTNTFNFTRSNDKFEQVTAYHAVDQVQTWIQSLGFTNINNESQDLKINTDTADNSAFYYPADYIELGSGGVDDAEDVEVVWHEYGHAVHYAQVPNYGTNHDSNSIGEGFGDYLAAAMTQGNSPDTAITPWACVMDWDSVSYTSTKPHCIRRLDTGKTLADETGEVHDDGEIWSHALWEINKAFGREKATKIILEAQFNFSPSTSFEAAAQRTVDAALALYDQATADTVEATFLERGINPA